MNVRDIVEVFEEVAVLLQLKGENPFKIRAFESAARTLQQEEGSATALLERLENGAVKGIGPQLREHILTILQLGTLPYLDELKAEFPPSLLELLELPGVGPKKVIALRSSLGIESIPALKEACEAGAVAKLKGFGAKTEAKILEGISRRETYQSAFLISEADRASAPLLTALNDIPGVESASVAGSLRRRKETVHDVDLVCSSSTQVETAAALHTLPGVISVTGQGETKVSVVLASGLQVDIRVVEPEQYPSAQLHFTGSKEHNTLLRARAKQRGLKLNEYGLFEGDTPLPCQSERDLYHHLGLSYIPPELREGGTEVELAEQAFKAGEDLPSLIALSDIKGILHVHSTYSDGMQSIRELAEFCKQAGYEYLGMTDHSQSAAYANGLRPEALLRQFREIEALNTELAPFRIFKGIESDILQDGALDYPEAILSQFDFVIASIHSRFTMDQAAMTARIIRALENPYTTILGHVSGRLLLKREAYQIDIGPILDAAAKYQVAVEINANPRRLDLDWRYLAAAKQRGIQIPICPDAHALEEFSYMQYGIDMGRKGGLIKEDVLNTKGASELASYFKERKNG